MQDDPVPNPNPSPVQAPVSDQNVSSFRKESGPMTSEKATSAVESVLSRSEIEPNLSPEVEQAGVQKVSDNLKLTTEQKDAGLSLAKESTPVNTNPTGVVLPMDSVSATQKVKGDPSNSMTWLAKLVLVYLKKLGGKNA